MISYNSEKLLSALFVSLLAAFIGRVLMQWAQALWSLPWLPAFESWQSGLLPYPVLLTCQMMIIAGSLSFLVKIRRQVFVRHARRGLVLAGLGGLYLIFDVARIGLGATVLRGHPFFDNPIPASFHVVLAMMTLIWAAFHLKKPAPKA